MPRGSDGGTGKKRVPRETERNEEREEWKEGDVGHQDEHQKPNGRRKRRCSTAVPAYNTLFPASADEIEPRAGPTSATRVFLQPSLFPRFHSFGLISVYSPVFAWEMDVAWNCSRIVLRFLMDRTRRNDFSKFWWIDRILLSKSSASFIFVVVSQCRFYTEATFIYRSKSRGKGSRNNDAILFTLDSVRCCLHYSQTTDFRELNHLVL